MITTEADIDKHLICVSLEWELVLTIYNKQEHFLYCLLYIISICNSILAIYEQY